jgi:hypothetical protein
MGNPKLDLWPLLEQLTFKTKSAKLIRFDRNAPFAWAQRQFVAEVERQYNEGLPVRIIVLKGRQIGISTVTEAILFLWCFLHPGTNAVVLSRDQESSDYLFGMTKRFWTTSPMHGTFNTKYDRIGYLEWQPPILSTFTTSTAGKDDPGRGQTIQAAHLSECAFWEDADDIASALGEAIPNEHGTIQVLESTAQGVGGYFHDEWMKAIDPSGHKSDFKPFFFEWWKHDEYEIKTTHLKYRDLDEEEKELLEQYPQMTIPKLAWRRRKINSYQNPETFKEEYPNSMEEAFLSTGSNVFPLAKLAKCYEPDVEQEQGYLYNDGGRLSFMESPEGHMTIYKRPDPRGRRRYVVACDPTWTVDGDPACIQVIDRASLEQVAVWHGSADPTTVGEISLAIALFYGPDAILNTEVQGGGKVVMGVWRDANYQHIWMDRRPDRPKLMMQAYGWNSTYETKRLMLGTMQGLIHREQVLIHHPATYYEMTRYVSAEDGTYGPSRRSGHDDTVISLGIGWLTVVTEDTQLDYSAMAAAGPAYVPGQTAPRFQGQGQSVSRALSDRFGSIMDTSDEMIGIEATY